jgi:hypothetical protein
VYIHVYTHMPKYINMYEYIFLYIHIYIIIHNCSNQDAELFISDSAAGDTICMECGNIVDDHHIDHGQEKRNFEDKEV